MANASDMEFTKAEMKTCANMLSNLYNLRAEDKLERMELRCKDGQLTAHKTIMASRSEYFSLMFDYPTLENQTNVVNLPDICVDVMEVIVKYFYAIKIPNAEDLPDDLVRRVIIAADKMLLNELFDKYWEVYFIEITKHNYSRRWELAQLFNKTVMIRNIEKFILDNLKELGERIERCHLESLLESELMYELNDEKYTEFVDCILSWGSREMDEGEYNTKEAANLVSKCDLSKLPRSRLNELMVKNMFPLNEIGKIVNDEIVRRFLASSDPKILVHAIHVSPDCVCTKHTYSLSENKWLTPETWIRPEMPSGKIDCIPSYAPDRYHWSYKGHPYAIRVCDEHEYRDENYETATSSAVYFASGDQPMVKFDFRTKDWTLDIEYDNEYKNNSYHGEYDTMLLVHNNKFYFGGPEKKSAIAIYDRILKSSVVRVAPESGFDYFNCSSKHLDENSNISLFFYDQHVRKLAFFDITTNTWQIDPVPVHTDINMDSIQFICYDESFIITTKVGNDTNYIIYSLKTRSEIASLEILSGDLFFDLSIQK